jgi:acyl carrier protein
VTSQQIEQIETIFRAVLQLPDGADPRAAAPGATPTWDSLAHVTLVAALENEFGVSIDPGDALRLTSFDDTLAVLAELGA